MITPQRNSPDPPAPDGRAVFFLGTLLMALGIFALLHGMSNTPSDISHCAHRMARTAPFFSKVLVAVYWLNVAAGLVYIILFLAWWVRRHPPWSETNDVAFSRIAWSGRRAWELAVQELLDSLTAPEVPLRHRLERLGHFVLAVSCIAATAVLLIVLLTCDACPSSWNNTCTGSAGGASASAFILITYFDFRIKFRRAQLKAQ